MHLIESIKVKCSLPQVTYLMEQLLWKLVHYYVYYVSVFFLKCFHLHAYSVYSGQHTEQPSPSNTLQLLSFSFRHHPFSSKSSLNRTIQRLHIPYSKMNVALLNMLQRLKQCMPDLYFLSSLCR